MMAIDRTGSAEVTLPSDLEIEIVRRFDAPAELVFDVWTKPEHVRNWWGWDTDEMSVCEIDLRVGGSYRFVAGNGDREVAFSGVYQLIDRPHRLVSTEVYEPYPESESTNTLTLEEEAGVTTMTIIVAHASKQARDATLASGMERGLQHSLDRVDEVLIAEMGEMALLFTLGLVAAVPALLSKAETDLVTVARASGGLPVAGESDATSQVSTLRGIRRVFAAVPIHRILGAVELSLLAVAAAVVDAATGTMAGSRALLLTAVAVGVIVALGHPVMILTSRRLR